MALQVGHYVGSYRIVAEVSHGTLADIYKATHSILTNRTVALKLLYTTRLHSEADSNQFFQEARILEQLKHPHILAVVDASIYEKNPYIVTEFAAHGSLRDRLRHIRSRPMPLDEVLNILHQVGEALQFAHQHKVVHCDVKPENILFNAHDEVLLSDFDVARVVGRANAQATNLAGTPPYMAPEQWMGKVRPESDQYALACVAYELLTGQQPFHDSDLEATKQKHLHEQPVFPPHARLPLHVEQTILRALAKKPAERFPDIATFITTLESAEWHQDGEHTPRLVLKDAFSNEKDADIYYESTVALASEHDPSPSPEYYAPTVADAVPARKRRTPATAAPTKKHPATKTKKRESDEEASSRPRTAARTKVVESTPRISAAQQALRAIQPKTPELPEKPVAAKKRAATRTASTTTSTAKKTTSTEKKSKPHPASGTRKKTAE